MDIHAGTFYAKAYDRVIAFAPLICFVASCETLCSIEETQNILYATAP
jgi:hypothetical protein